MHHYESDLIAAHRAINAATDATVAARNAVRRIADKGCPRVEILSRAAFLFADALDRLTAARAELQKLGG